MRRKGFEVITVPDAYTLQEVLDLRKEWRDLRVESHVMHGHFHVVVLSWEAHADRTPCLIGETAQECARHNN